MSGIFFHNQRLFYYFSAEKGVLRNIEQTVRQLSLQSGGKDHWLPIAEYEIYARLVEHGLL